MKRIISILLSVLLMFMLSVTAFAENELIKTEDDAVEAAKREIEVWKEMGLLCPEVSLSEEPDSIVEIEPSTGDDYWYGREFSHAYEVRWWMAARIGTELEVPAYGCNLRIDAKTGKIIQADIEAIATGDDEPASEKTLELEMGDPLDSTKTVKETKTIYFYDNFDDIFSADMTVDSFCTLLAEYWGFSGYTLAETIDEAYFDEPIPPVEASSLLKDMPTDTAVNYYLTVFFDGDQEGAPVYIYLQQYPGYVMLSVGVTHAVG